jgi:pyruvate dehydrogenase E1 component
MNSSSASTDGAPGMPHSDPCSALGPLFGTRLLPIGTLYDPFIERGLDALNYACYQDARFILVATQSGITLAPEGGAHHSVGEPLMGSPSPGSRASSRPTPTSSRSCCAGRSRRSSATPASRSISGCRPGRSSSPGERSTRTLPRRSLPAPIGSPSRGPERSSRSPMRCGRTRGARRASAVAEDIPEAGLLAITSPDRLHRDWLATRARGDMGVAERLLVRLLPSAALVTVGDFYPATLSWLGAVADDAIVPLGVDRFGQSGDIPDLYRAYGIDTDAILNAAARACLTALRRTR